MKKTLVDLFENSVKLYPNNTFLLEKTDKVFEPTTYTQVKEKVYKLGAGLQALGVKKGDSMALLSPESPWRRRRGCLRRCPSYRGSRHRPHTAPRW